MKRMLFVICYLLLSLSCVCQSSESYTGFVKYMNAHDSFICDTSIIYIIENNKFTSVQNVSECGMVYSNLKEGLWECFDKNGNLICHRYYDYGKIRYEIRYSEGKATTFIDFLYVPDMLSGSCGDKRFKRTKKREYPLAINQVLTFDENGGLKTKYFYDYNKNERIEIVYP